MLFDQIIASHRHACRISNKCPKLIHMRLVVKNLAFVFAARDGAELSSADSIPHSELQGPHQRRTSCRDNLLSDCNHYLIQSSEVTSDFKVTLPINSCQSTEHVCSRNPDMVKDQPTVIHAVIAKLSAEIPNFDSLQWNMGLQVPDLYHKWLHSKIVFINDQSCKYNCVVCNNAHAPRPHLS